MSPKLRKHLKNTIKEFQTNLFMSDLRKSELNRLIELSNDKIAQKFFYEPMNEKDIRKDLEKEMKYFNHFDNLITEIKELMEKHS